MKKSLIALAVAGALVAPVAMADVTIYGQANVSYDMVNNGNTAAATAADVANLAFATAPVAGAPYDAGSATKVSSNSSRIGFKGSEDLGGGTSAVWQIEQTVNMDGGAGTGLGTRNTFAGLSSESMGTVILGQHDTPYKLATRGLDLFADTIADNRSLMGQSAGGALGTGNVHDVRASDVVAYISPAMSGFSAVVGYVAGAENVTNSAQVKGSGWSLAGMYNAGPVNASLSYQTVDGGSVTTNTGVPFAGVGLTAGAANKVKAWKLGGGYTMDAFQVNAVYESTSSSFGGVDTAAQKNWYLAGKFNVSASDAVKLAYTRAGKNPQGGVLGDVVDSEANQLSLGYDHAMSKRTTVYALYSKLNNGTAAAYGFTGAATTGGSVATLQGADPSVWSLGMKHSF